MYLFFIFSWQEYIKIAPIVNTVSVFPSQAVIKAGGLPGTHAIQYYVAQQPVGHPSREENIPIFLSRL